MAQGPHIYWRERGGVRRAYADFRAYADVGGAQEALIPPGQQRATSDPVIAHALFVERLKQLEERRRSGALLGVRRRVGLADFAREHLIAKAKAGRVTVRCLRESEQHLRRAIEYFGSNRELLAIAPADVRAWVETLQAKGLAGGTVRHHLNALSNLYRRAQAEGHVLPGYNPVAALLEKPSAARQEARWLEVHDAALFLEAARCYRPKRPDLATPFAYQVLATFLLTGGRRSEVLCLEVDDISFDRRTVTFRPNRWREALGLKREMKTATSWRTVPLWPQLEEILRPYVFPADRTPRSGLLFPPSRTEDRCLKPRLCDMRKFIDAVAVRAGWQPGEITTKVFRHTYCAARLQTLDHGAPVSIYTVARELGHGSEAMVKRVYGHLGTVRHRSEVVEYRVEQHRAKLEGRLAAVRTGL